MSLEQRLEKPPIPSFGFFSRKTTESEEPGSLPTAGFRKSEELSGKIEGLRRPCRFQPFCLLGAWPRPTCSLLLSDVLAVSRL